MIDARLDHVKNFLLNYLQFDGRLEDLFGFPIRLP
jgi:hypothetical protein